MKSEYITSTTVYRDLFAMFAHSIRGTETLTPQQAKRFDALAKFCDWVCQYKPTKDDHLLHDGRWSTHDDIDAMIVYLVNPKEFKHKHGLDSFDAFLKRVGVKPKMEEVA